MTLAYRITFISDQPRLTALSERLCAVSALAVDLETINWWHPPTEQIALIQLAYRAQDEVRVAVIDALAQLDLTPLRQPLELSSATKIMHNAGFDAVRLARHLQITAAPIHDTMLTARRSGEKRYSLKAQVEKHLQLPLDKRAQQSDWSLRPLSPKQLDYAALDAVATLMLYEHQRQRGLTGAYRPSAKRAAEQQVGLPLAGTMLPVGQSVEQPAPPEQALAGSVDISASALALLGIITELPARYHPAQLAVSVGADRVGLAGWIVDRILGRDADLDEAEAKLRIAELCQQGWVRITPTRRLEARAVGQSIWQKHKPI